MNAIHAQWRKPALGLQLSMLKTVSKFIMAARPARINGDYLVACPAEDYDRLFLEKQQMLRTLLSWTGPVEAFDSPRQHFRFRANFQMWHEDGKNRTPERFFYSMYDGKDPKVPREIVTFPPGTERLNELMRDLRPYFHNPIIFDSLFEVRFVTTKASPEQCIIVLCYKRPLPETWLSAAEEIAKNLRCKVIGRARKMMQLTGGTFPDEFIQEILEVEGRQYTLFQTEGAFSQPNAYVCEKMITWALDVTRPPSSSEAAGRTEDLLELYCGGGTFTGPLSHHFRRVLATEISTASVALAKRCFEANHLQEKIMVARVSSEEFSAWFRQHVLKQTVTTSTTKAEREISKELTRLGLTSIEHDLNLTTVFVDPPRAGLDPDTCALLSLFDKIVYISCNPETLARDVRMLQATHDILRVAAFDQFPYTHHLESGVFMVKRSTTTEGETEDSVLGKRIRDPEQVQTDADAHGEKR